MGKFFLGLLLISRFVMNEVGQTSDSEINLKVFFLHLLFLSLYLGRTSGEEYVDFQRIGVGGNYREEYFDFQRIGVGGAMKG